MKQIKDMENQYGALEYTETFCRARKKIAESSKTVCIIHIKQGFGKDQLIQSILSNNKEPPVYLKLEQKFGALKEFIYWLTKSLDCSKLNYREIFDYVEEHQISCVVADYISAAWTEGLLGDTRTVKVIVFDEIQFIQTWDILYLLNHFIQLVNGRIKIILSMSSCPLHIAPLYNTLSDKAEVITTKDMVLTKKDTKILVEVLNLQDQAGKDKMAQRLYAYMGGWPFGICSAIQLLKKEKGLKDIDSVCSVSSHPVYSQYISRYMEESLAIDEKKFLLKIHKMKIIDAQTCDRELGIHWSKGYLERFKGEGLILKSGEEGDKYWISGILKEYFDTHTQAGPGYNQEKVYITTLGEFSVTYGEKQVLWRTKKVKELAAFLVYKKGKPVTKELMIETLWPECQEKKASQLFHTTISYLRKNLQDAGIHELIETANKEYYINTQRYDTDYDKLLEIKKTVDGQQWTKLKQLPDLLNLYQGSFLEFCSGQWCQGEQVYWEQICLQCLRMIGSHEREEGRVQKALQYYLYYRKINSYTEDIIISILNCYGKLENYEAVKQLYGETRNLYKKELELPLPAKIRETYVKCMGRMGK